MSKLNKDSIPHPVPSHVLGAYEQQQSPVKRVMRRIHGESSRKEVKREDSSKREVLKVACPVEGCDESIYLLCSECGSGVLKCHEESLSISCEQCKSFVKGIKCAKGHSIKPAYIREKQSVLRHVREAADGSKFGAVLMTFAAFWFFVEALKFVGIYFYR
jgi:hypothetical protein